MKNKILHAFLLSILILVMAPPLSGSAQASRTVRLALISPIQTLDPQFATSYSEILLDEQLFLGLTGIDNQGSIQPELAYKWDVSDDGLAWTFYLQQGVQWVDPSGQARGDVTARDVVASMERARVVNQPAVGVAAFPFLPFIASVTEVDPYTVAFTLSTPTDSLLAYLALPSLRPLPAELLKAYGDKWAQPGVMWSNGPYLLANWSGQKVELALNPVWGDGQSIQVRRVIVEYIDEREEAMRRYQGGDVDLFELDSDFAPIVLQDPRLAGEVHQVSNTTSLELLRIATFAARDYDFLVKPYVQPVFSGFLGLGGFQEWQLKTNDPAVSIPSTTRVLDLETLSSLQTIAADQSQLVFASLTPQLSVIQAGDIIVGDSTRKLSSNPAPFGFLRRVVSTSTDASGQFIIDTVQAALDEAIERGNATYSISLQPGDLYREETLTTSSLPQKNQIVRVNYVSPQSNFYVDIDQAVYDADGDKTTTNDQVMASGRVELQDVRFDLSLAIQDYKLQSLSFSNTVTEVGRVSLYSNVDILGFEKTIPIKRIIFVPQTVWIGWVPLVFTPQLTVYVGANGAVSVGVSAGIKQQATITTGVNYASGVWTPIGQVYDDQISSLETNISQSAGAGAFVAPELSLKLYDVAGPYGRIKSYLDFRADPTQSPWWTLVGGVRAELGVKVEVFSHVVAGYENPPYAIVPEKILAQAETGPEETGNGEPQAPDPSPTLPASTPAPIYSPWWPPSHWPLWLWVIAVVIVLILISRIL